MAIHIENLKIQIDSKTSDGGYIELSVSGGECQMQIESGQDNYKRTDVRIALQDLSAALDLIKSYLQNKFTN